MAAVMLDGFIRSASPQPLSDESRIKAAVVFRLPQFVEWPPAALDGRSRLDLCVLGHGPFGDILRDLAEGETIAGRRLEVRSVREDAAAGCHLLFVPSNGVARRPLLRRLRSEPVLTVSDAPDFLDEGGAVMLRVVDRRVRFEVNLGAADTAGLRLRAQLLRLAVNVRRSAP